MELKLIEEQGLFLKNLETQGKSFNTVKNYKADLNCFNEFLANKQKNLKFKSFTTTQVNEYSQYLEEKYGSPNSIRRRVQALRLFFDFLILKGSFPENPLKKMPVAPKVLDLPRPTPFTQITKFYQHLQKDLKEAQTDLAKCVASRNVILFHLIYGTGLKVSDLAKLPYSAVLKEKDGFRILVQHPKRDPYSIPLPKLFTRDFKIYKELYQAQMKAEGVEFDALLFNSNPYRMISGGLSPRGTELLFEEWRRKLKFEMTAKSLRQSCIFKWLNQKVNETTIKEWLGVAPNYTLELYTDLLAKKPMDYVFSEMEDRS
jgi:site-specific recombinase XerD